jgi:hypothetical protein
MSFVEDNIDKIKIGFDGEAEIRKLFNKHNIPFMQVDVMFLFNGKWCLGEIKTQEKYLAPPFDGHGLPKWQIDRRIQFYNDTGVIPYLIVNCLTDKKIYIGNLNELMKGEYFQTKGTNPRVIFKIENFKIYENY